jgi:hypothetical protein
LGLGSFCASRSSPRTVVVEREQVSKVGAADPCHEDGDGAHSGSAGPCIIILDVCRSVAAKVLWSSLVWCAPSGGRCRRLTYRSWVGVRPIICVVLYYCSVVCGWGPAGDVPCPARKAPDARRGRSFVIYSQLMSIRELVFFGQMVKTIL